MIGNPTDQHRSAAVTGGTGSSGQCAALSGTQDGATPDQRLEAPHRAAFQGISRRQSDNAECNGGTAPKRFSARNSRSWQCPRC